MLAIDRELKTDEKYLNNAFTTRHPPFPNSTPSYTEVNMASNITTPESGATLNMRPMPGQDFVGPLCSTKSEHWPKNAAYTSISTMASPHSTPPWNLASCKKPSPSQTRANPNRSLRHRWHDLWQNHGTRRTRSRQKSEVLKESNVTLWHRIGEPTPAQTVDTLPTNGCDDFKISDSSSHI